MMIKGKDLEIIVICLQLYTSMLHRNMISAGKGTGDTPKWRTQSLGPIYARNGPGCSRTIQGLISHFQKWLV